MSNTPERWRGVARIFEAATSYDAAAREAFLVESCAGDQALRREVESLLRQHDAECFLDRSVWTIAAALFEDGPDLRSGATLGPYRIESPLGAGGMGEVYRATDIRLSRPVAIKVLPTDLALDRQMRDRFAREARAVAALTHPNICTLYDVGLDDRIDFLVMEYLEGETLAARLEAGRLSFDQALTHAIEIASALDHAHRHGIVHRDLKPANIMLTASGAKLLDFGLAIVRPATGGGTRTTVVAGDGVVPEIRESGRVERDGAYLTREGAVLGTLQYMAPERMQGHEGDAQSDLFSFGVVFFEMLTGRRALEGSDGESVGAAVRAYEPPPVSSLQPLAPQALDEIVRRCLARDAGERWSAAGEIVRKLKQVVESIAEARVPARRTDAMQAWRWIAGILTAAVASLVVGVLASGIHLWPLALSPGQIRSVAVLPLDNLSGDPEQEYLAEGVTDQLIADLARVGGLRVISRASVMHYRDSRKPAPAIAQELKVDAIIEGAVVRAGDTVRITAKLIRRGSGQVVWTQSFERGSRDVLALPRDMARAIASEVGMGLTPQEQLRFSSARPVDPEVHRQVLLGRHHAAKATEEGLRRAVQYFDRAIASDPDNALAHAGLAQAYTSLNGFYMDPREAMPRAKRAAETAIRVDESLADAHSELGFIHLVYDWDGPAAEKELLRALDLNPTLATARLRYAAYLASQARHDDAVREIRRAVDLDPMSIQTHAFGTLFLLFSRRYEEAVELARQSLEFEPNSGFTLAFQGVAYAQLGRYEEAMGNLQKAAELDNSPTIRALQAHVLAVAGRRADARKLVRQLEADTKDQYFCPYEIGTVYVSLGDADTACDWFRKGLQGHADCMAWLGVEPWLDPFRSDPRYAGLLRDVGLTPAPR